MVAAMAHHDTKSGKESFAALLEESLGGGNSIVGSVLKGTVVDIRNDLVLVDVGLKSEGYIPVREFTASGDAAKLPAIGSEVDIYVERYEDKNGEVVLSREKARREASWIDLENAYAKNQPVPGVIFGKVKGGFTVDVSGAVAFLPNSQLDIRPIRDASPLMNIEQPFIILKMDRKRGNIVVSRRAVLEESKAEAQAELIGQIQEGQVLQGIVKNITDYGAFIDLGGVDGLLHVTDISWKRINHPSEALQVGQSITVKIIRFNDETKRVSLGMKQLDDDPWLKISESFPVGSRHVGKVTNIADYGAFIELTSGIEGLVHVSEMSWTRKNATPNQIVSISQAVEVMVLEIDMDKRRISLGMKQCQENPFKAFAEKHPEGSTVTGEITSTGKSGIAVALADGIEGFISVHDLSWEKNAGELLDTYKKGDSITAKIIDINPEKNTVTLGIKQLSDDPFGSVLKDLKKGSVVTCTITKLQDNGIEVEVASGVTGFIKKSDLSRDRSEQHTDRFAVGEKVDAMIMTIDKSTRKVTLSIKAREVEEEKQVMAEYGSTDSGASLGDILGPVMNRAVSKDSAGAEEALAKPAKTKKAKAKDA